MKLISKIKSSKLFKKTVAMIASATVAVSAFAVNAFAADGGGSSTSVSSALSNVGTKLLDGFPLIAPCKIGVPLSSVRWIDFDTAISGSKRDRSIYKKYNGLHFYIDDYKFQRIWNYPKRYINFLKNYDYVIMPDFSLYYNYPQALQIYNKYRNHWLAAYFAVNGVNIVPDISLSTPDCFDWSGEAYPQMSLVAFCDVGSKRDKSCREVIPQAFEFMQEKLFPSHIIYFTRSKTVNFEDSNITVVRLPFFRSKGGD